MDHVLSQALLSLGDDAGLRKRNVRSLVSTLTSHELLDLRAFLTSLDSRKDFVPLLPPELHLMLLENLDQHDICNLWLVSKAWHTTWTSEAVVQKLATQYFPGMREVRELQIQKGLPAIDIRSSFIKTQQGLHNLTHGRYKSTFYWDVTIHQRDKIFRFDPVLHPPKSGQEWTTWLDVFPDIDGISLENGDIAMNNGLYCNGRIVWQADRPAAEQCSVVVDDLRTRFRKVYHIPLGWQQMMEETPELAAVGDTLAVVTYRNTIFAWDMKTNETKSIKLPFRPSCPETRGHLVCIANRVSGRPAVWRFGGPVLELDLSPAQPDFDAAFQNKDKERSSPFHEELFDFIFHPVLDDVFYVVQDHAWGLSIYEYTGDTITNSFHRPERKFPANRRYSARGNQKCSVANAYGCYVVYRSSHNRGMYPESVNICFDILRGMFYTTRYIDTDRLCEDLVSREMDGRDASARRSRMPPHSECSNIWNGFRMTVLVGDFKQEPRPVRRLWGPANFAIDDGDSLSDEEMDSSDEEGQLPRTNKDARDASVVVITRQADATDALLYAPPKRDESAWDNRVRGCNGSVQHLAHKSNTRKLPFRRDIQHYLLDIETSYLQANVRAIMADDHFLVATYDHCYYVWEY